MRSEKTDQSPRNRRTTEWLYLQPNPEIALTSRWTVPSTPCVRACVRARVRALMRACTDSRLTPEGRMQYVITHARTQRTHAAHVHERGRTLPAGVYRWSIIDI